MRTSFSVEQMASRFANGDFFKLYLVCLNHLNVEGST